MAALAPGHATAPRAARASAPLPQPPRAARRAAARPAAPPAQESPRPHPRLVSAPSHTPTTAPPLPSLLPQQRSSGGAGGGASGSAAAAACAEPEASAACGECRICGDEAPLSELEAPCGCRGGLRHVHAKCCQRWIDEKGDAQCEICLQPLLGPFRVPPARRAPPAPRPPHHDTGARCTPDGDDACFLLLLVCC
jgi:hypothetical protein